MKGEPALPQGLLHWGRYTLSLVHDSPVTEICVKQGSNRGHAPSTSYCSTEGVAPFIHCATSAGHALPVLVLRHQCWIVPPVPVLHHQ